MSPVRVHLRFRTRAKLQTLSNEGCGPVLNLRPALHGTASVSKRCSVHRLRRRLQRRKNPLLPHLRQNESSEVSPRQETGSPRLVIILFTGGMRPSSLAECDFLVAIVSMPLSRWLPQKSFPPYAYLPGRNPHPVRNPTGHSYHVGPLPVATEASLGSDAFLWGVDLFNHGYYWEAHEA